MSYNSQLNNILNRVEDHLFGETFKLPGNISYNIKAAGQDAGLVRVTYPHEIIHHISAQTVIGLIYEVLTPKEVEELSQALNIEQANAKVLAEQLQLLFDKVQNNIHLSTSESNFLTVFSEVLAIALVRANTLNKEGKYTLIIQELYLIILHELQHIYDRDLAIKNGFRLYERNLQHDHQQLDQYCSKLFDRLKPSQYIRISQLFLAFFLWHESDPSLKEELMQTFYINGWREIRAHILDIPKDKRNDIMDISNYLFGSLYLDLTYFLNGIYLPGINVIENAFQENNLDFQAVWAFTDRQLTLDSYSIFKQEFLNQLPALQEELLKAGLTN